MATRPPTGEDIRRGATIRALREGQGLSLAALAEASAISKRQLINYENGKVPVPAAKCRLIARALSIPPIAIVGPDEVTGSAA